MKNALTKVKKMTKVINLFGGPGVGKSTIAAGLFYNMKIAGYNVEAPQEWCKQKVYEGTKYPFKDQLYTYACQNKLIKQLIGKVDYVICDSPLFLSVIYQSEETPLFSAYATENFNRYDNINFLIRRHHKYQHTGRLHTEKQSCEISTILEEKLNEFNIDYTPLNSGTAVKDILRILEIHV